MNFLLLLLLLTPTAAPRHPLHITFRNEVGGQALILGDRHYTNRFNEPFTLLQCKYYISDLRARNSHREEPLLPQPHLVDQADPASLDLSLTTTLDSVTAIVFSIGVDSLYTTNGVQSGDLDPMLGMFWTWNTGYIHLRLEGISDSAHAPAHRFTWDIGGYRPSQNTLRTVTLQLPAATNPKTKTNAKTHAETNRLITIHTDIQNLFDGAHPIPIAKSPICHEPGPLAMQLADNYSTLFHP